MNPALIELIILAGIAVFLFLRLRSVLGTREGFEKPRMQPKNDAPKRDFKVIDGGEDKDITDNVEKNSKSAKALKIIKEKCLYLLGQLEDKFRAFVLAVCLKY